MVWVRTGGREAGEGGGWGGRGGEVGGGGEEEEEGARWGEVEERRRGRRGGGDAGERGIHYESWNSSHGQTFTLLQHTFMLGESAHLQFQHLQGRADAFQQRFYLPTQLFWRYSLHANGGRGTGKGTFKHDF